MKILSLLLISAALFGSHIAIAAPDEVEQNLEKKILNPLRFTNRSQCAIDSQSPTTSLFLMIDGYNAGKAGHSLAKLANLDADEYSARAMREFRLAATYMTLNIMNKMMRGQLPLLPTNIEKSPLKGYVNAVQKCEQTMNCPEMNEYISQIWKNAGSKPALQTVDRFTQANYPRHATKDRLGCYYIKKFSGLQAPLQQTEANKAVLQDVALAYLNDGDYITGCFDSTETLDSRYATIQIDWETNQESLKVQGFDFWNSLKIYLSWAWRNSDELTKMSPTFSQIFKSIALEEAILFTPNGCRSMAPPSCDSEYLAQNSVRELAKANAVSKEHFQNVPASTEREMLEKGVRGVNNDFLGTQSQLTAQEWLAGFRKNVVQSRGLMKTKYQSAVQNLNLIADNLGSAKLIAGLQATIAAKDASTDQISNELYYLCTELRLTADDQIDFLKSDIDRLAQLKNLSRLEYSDRRTVKDFLAFFKEISAQAMPICEQLEKVNYWNRENYIVNRTGFASWSRELLQLKEEPEAAKFTPAPVNGAPMLSWSNPTTTAQAICMNPTDCIRLAMKSLVDLYAVATYADAVMPLAGTTATPNLFNPYSELSSCKMYDPWFATKRMNKVFIADLANTALFGWNFLPIYVDANFSIPRVASFKQLVDKGVIKFDPRLDKSKLEKTMIADFGPLTGAPCAVSVDNQGMKNFNFYSFTGITVNYCDGKQTSEVVAQKPSEMVSSPTKSRAICGACTINLQSVATSASATTVGALNPVKFFVYVFRTFSKLYEAKQDNVNLPISSNVNPAYAAEVYQKYGEVPTQCVEQLGRGLRCFQNTCSAVIADAFERQYKTKVRDVYLKNDENSGTANSEAWIKSDLCNGEVIVPASCTKNRDGSYKPYLGSPRGFTKTCRKAMGR